MIDFTYEKAETVAGALSLFNDIPDPFSPLGARGNGEIGITGLAAAIANAILKATGKRIRALPITLDKLLDLE